MIMRHVKLGLNETNIKHLTTCNYPERCIIVKMINDSSFEVNFMGETPPSFPKDGWLQRTPRTNMIVYQKLHRYDNGASVSFVRSGVYDHIEFKKPINLEKLNEYMVYINYIISQVKVP